MADERYPLLVYVDQRHSYVKMGERWFWAVRMALRQAEAELCVQSAGQLYVGNDLGEQET